ncbi:MAG: PASTA domain-containing protein [Candidatus Dormibacteria bacterium]
MATFSAVIAVAALLVSGCGTSPEKLPLSLRYGVVQVLAGDGNAYHSYRASWTVTTLGDLQAAAPMAGDELLSGSSFFKYAYVAVLGGSFHNPLCVPGHGSICRGRYLLVALPITSRPGAYAEANQVSDSPVSLGALGLVRHSTLKGLRIEPRGRVPDVVGLAAAQAERVLSLAGLAATEVVGGATRVPMTVTFQSPSAGAPAKPGQEVRLVISVP